MKMVLDTDIGVDDTLALSFALASPEIELLAVTATFGNVSTSQSAANARALLALFGRRDIPVIEGAAHALASDSFEPHPGTVRLHGRNGTADIEIPASLGGDADAEAACSTAQPLPSSQVPDVADIPGLAGERSACPTDGSSAQAPDAADFIIDAVRAYGDGLVLVPVGSPTNIALAIQRAPEIARSMRIVMMGGALTVPGNVTPFAEANIEQDPEAARIIFESGADVTMVGLDATLRALTTKGFTARLRSTGDAAGVFLADMTDHYIDVDADVEPALKGLCTLHDPLAVGVAFDPSFVETIDVPLTVELDGPSRGRTIGDVRRVVLRRRAAGCALPVHVAVNTDTTRFVELFERRILELVEDHAHRVA